jgi:hypothetical protein
MDIDDALKFVEHEPDDCQCAFCLGAKQLAKEVRRLREIIGMAVDGVLVPDCEHFFCPHCGKEARVCIDRAYCDTCGNPDSFGEPPLGLFLDSSGKVHNYLVKGG